MKKLLFVSLLQSICGYLYAYENVDITTGTYIESENHNTLYNPDDVTVHGLRVNVNAKDFPLWTEFVYEYRNADSPSGQANNADRYKFMVGTGLNYGNFSFKPEYELRITDSRKSPQKITDHRIKPNWHYKFNDDKTTLFNSWMVGYRVTDDYRGHTQTKSWNDYFHELESGVKHQFATDQSVVFSVYNEYIKNEKSDLELRAYKFDDWQIRLAYEKKFSNKISVSPFIRYSVTSTSEYTNQIDGDHNGKTRCGVKMGYTADNGIEISGETYYQNEPQKRSNGQDRADKSRFYFKLGLDFKF